MFSVETYFGCFLVGLVVTLLVTPLVASLATRWDVVDRPVGRKIHRRIVPRLGGIALWLGMWLPLVLVSLYDNFIGRQVLANENRLLLILMGSTCMLLLGILDDFRGLDAKRKLALELPLALALVGLGVNFTTIDVPFLGQVSLGPFGSMVSVLWLIGVTNALNLIDGIDGLAVGVAFLISVTIAVLAVQNGSTLLALSMCSMAGACLGFLRHNFSPAKIFLGDSGSLLLGMTLAVSATVCDSKETLGTSLLLPVILLGYPISDTLLSMLRRFLNGKPVFTGDASHIHHRLLKKGLDHRKACLVIYSVCIVFCLWTYAIAHQHLPGMILGTLAVATLAVVGIVSLGYLNHFRSPHVARERYQFKAAHHLAEMTKAQFRIAETREDVIKLLRKAAQEYGRTALEVRLSGDGREKLPPPPVWEDRDGRQSWPDGGVPHHERYHFEDTGLFVGVACHPVPSSEELAIEKRRLFGEICVVANERLAAMGSLRDKTGSSETRPEDLKDASPLASSTDRE